MRKMKDKRVVFVTGASFGIGAAAAKALVKEGYTVYGLSRRGTAPDGVTPLACDVSDPLAVQRAVDEVLLREGRIDHALLSAGCGISGAVEFISPTEAERQMAVNFSGVDNALRSLTPALRQSRGRVLIISSVAAVFPIPFQAHYAAGKAALNSFVRAYGIEVSPFGIQAGCLMLGDCATGFTDARQKSLVGDALYGGRIEGGVRSMERSERRGTRPEKIAKKIVRLMKKRRLPSLCTAGLDYKLLVFLSKILPIRLQNFILSRLYG